MKAKQLSKAAIAKRTVKSKIASPAARRAKILEAASKVGKTSRINFARSVRG